MHLQKLVEVLKKLDEGQVKRLDEYVRSPYFRIPPVCVLLLNRLMPLHPRFMEAKMQWQKLGKKDITLSTIAKQRNAATGLLKAIDGFIAQEQWQLNKLETARLKLKGYKQLQLEEKFDDGYREQIAFLEDEPEQDVDTFYEKHMLVELSMQGFKSKAKRNAQNDIGPVLATLDVFYAIKKLRYLCEAANRKQLLGLEYKTDGVEALIQILANCTTPKYRYVYIFVNVYRMITANSFEDSMLFYELVKENIRDCDSVHPPQSVIEAVDYMQIVCLRWSNKGIKAAAGEYLLWMDWKLKHNLLLKEDKLQPTIFRNIISMARIHGDVGRMKKVIDEYSGYLPSNVYESNLMFANGLYYYTQNDYINSARAFLRAEAKDDMLFNCLIRVWHLRSSYEADSNDIDLLF